MKQNTTILNKMIIAIAGLFGSILFILLGYWIAGGIGYTQSDEVNFLTGLNIVLGAPFAPYFNNYTPILMLLFFIIFESLFFLLLVSLRRNERMAEQEAADISEEDKTEPQKGEEVFSDIFTDNDTTDSRQAESSEPDMDFDVILPETQIADTIEQPKVIFNDDIAMELLDEYTLDQVTAMLDISKYMKVNEAMLRRMFKPSMDAEEIKEYIQTFYES